MYCKTLIFIVIVFVLFLGCCGTTASTTSVGTNCQSPMPSTKCDDKKLVTYSCQYGTWREISNNCSFGCENNRCLSKTEACEDGTKVGNCSENKPQLCIFDINLSERAILVDRALICGCPENKSLIAEGKHCWHQIDQDITISTYSKSATIRITNISERYSNPNPFYKDKPNVKWIKFDLEIKNIGMEPILAPELTMWDENDREFEVYSCSSDVVPQILTHMLEDVMVKFQI